MEENVRNKIGFWFFLVFVIALAVGGYFFTNNLVSPKEKNNKIKNIKNYKIDKSKDYIYFENESVISEDAELYYKDVVINIKDQEILTETLKKENEIYKNNVKLISEQENINKQVIKHNNDNIYALTFRDYVIEESDLYVSLVVNDYNYSCFDLVTFNKSKAYVFDINKGTLLTKDDLLKKYKTDIDKIKIEVEKYLKKKQTKVNDVEVIKINDTLDNINDNSLFINEYGKLSVTYLVKTTQNDYNEITEV